MKARIFDAKKHDIANWPPDLTTRKPIGFAYDNGDQRCVLFGKTYALTNWALIDRVTEESLDDWVIRRFGAENLRMSKTEVGVVDCPVWRPGLENIGQLQHALDFSDPVIGNSSQAIRLLIEKLDRALEYIEPNDTGKNTYGHHLRELLILACTETENFFQFFLNYANVKPQRKYFSIHDYSKCSDPLGLDSFGTEMFSYPDVAVVEPFKGWSPDNPILPWYDAYNKVKHRRDSEFHQATLANCISAVSACLVLFSVRFGPHWWQGNFIDSPIPNAYRLFRQNLPHVVPEKTYIPLLERWPQVPVWGPDHLPVMSWDQRRLTLD